MAQKSTKLISFVFLTSVVLFLTDTPTLAFIPEVIGNPPAPAGNLDPPASFIGMLIAFFCFFLVVGVSLIPSKRSNAQD